MSSDIAENNSKVGNSRDKFNTIFKYALDGIVLIDTVSGYISDCNPEFERQSGRRLDDLKKMKIWEIRPPEKVDDAKVKFFEIVKNGFGSSHKLEFQRPDGKTTPIEFVSNLVKINEKQYILSMTRDITEHNKADELLYEAQQRFSSIYNTVGDVIFYIQVEEKEHYRFISVNPAFYRITGLSSETVIGNRVEEVIPEPSLTIVLEKYKQAIEKKTLVRWEEISNYPTGRLIGDVSVAPIFDAQGRCTHLVGSVHDITRIKLIEEELKKHRDNLEEQVKERTLELKNRNEELEKYNKLFVGRELRMVELKKIISEKEKIIYELEKQIVDLKK